MTKRLQKHLTRAGLLLALVLCVGAAVRYFSDSFLFSRIDHTAWIECQVNQTGGLIAPSFRLTAIDSDLPPALMMQGRERPLSIEVIDGVAYYENESENLNLHILVKGDLTVDLTAYSPQDHKLVLLHAVGVCEPAQVGGIT